MSVKIRPARTSDVKEIRKIIDSYAAPGRMLEKETVTLFESVQEFVVDLAEVRSVAVVEGRHKSGVGHQIMKAVIERAESLGVKRIFCLTFQTEFFGKHGFEVIEGTPVEPDVYQQLLRSYDAGVAEFLDLESVKPSTLGNTRMLKIL